jgi:hypothetical protein
MPGCFVMPGTGMTIIKYFLHPKYRAHQGFVAGKVVPGFGWALETGVREGIVIDDSANQVFT